MKYQRWIFRFVQPGFQRRWSRGSQSSQWLVSWRPAPHSPHWADQSGLSSCTPCHPARASGKKGQCCHAIFGTLETRHTGFHGLLHSECRLTQFQIHTGRTCNATNKIVGLRMSFHRVLHSFWNTKNNKYVKCSWCVLQISAKTQLLFILFISIFFL